MPQFGGAAEKCAVCNKTVYLAEKIVVEDKEDKKTFHKTCLKCSHCKVTLTLGNYASMNGVFYCKPHFKQLFATKGNYDEGFGKDKHTKNWTPQAVSSAPSSFVPVDKDEQTTASNSKKETPSSIASKFGRTTLNTEKCHVCNKTVYATEKTVIEEKEGKKVFHKTCLKCSHCNVIVTLGNYASMQGVVYCKPHFKQLFAAKGNYDEGFGKEKASSKWEPQVSTAPTTFVPVDKDDGPKEKRNAPEGIASRFKGTASNTEKCNSCGKTVYATERIVVEDKEDKQTYHKNCLKCSHCSVVLNLGNYASMNGVMYCKPHFKQLFAAKGNYDEGFGKEKHTKKWDKEGDEESGATSTTSTKEQKQEEDPQELEREIEAEKQQQREREQEKQRQEEEREERARQDEREAEEREERRREERQREEREEREREEREEQEREQNEADERKRLEEELEQGHKEQNVDDEEEKKEEHAHEHSHDDHDHDHHDHHDHEHSHDHEPEHEHEKEPEELPEEDKQDDE